MRPLALGALVLFASAPLLAQIKTVTSPPGYLTKGQVHSRSWGYRLGQYSNERFQVADGQFRNRVLIMKEISYRLDGGRTYGVNTTSAGVGRTWTNVTLNMAECDYDKMTSTFSTNRLSTPKKVYDAKTTWQSYGTKAADPSPWGGQGIKFPFTSSWVHTGKRDFLMEYAFSGGILANTNGAFLKHFHYNLFVRFTESVSQFVHGQSPASKRLGTPGQQAKLG